METNFIYTVRARDIYGDIFAKDLPANAPEWAKVRSTRHKGANWEFHGEGVEVTVDSGFTVVQLLAASWNHKHWKEANLFATRNGCTDDTREYRAMRFERKRKKDIAHYRDAGLSEAEAQRLFGIGNEPWTGEQKETLLTFARLFRNSRGFLRDLSRALSRTRQSLCITDARLEAPFVGLSCPRTQALAKKALWVFHNEKSIEEEATIRPLPVKSQAGLVSLATAFAQA
jgi:hypothetical protein